MKSRLTLQAASILCVLALGAHAADIDPADLTKDPALIDREIEVDARVRGGFDYHKERGFDEFLLEGSTVLFRLPAFLAFPKPPKTPTVVKAKGVLRKSGRRLVCDVKAIELLPSDIDRFAAAVATLRPNDLRGRQEWAAWGARRAERYNDDALAKRAAQVSAEALAIEASRASADRYALAVDAKKNGVAEPLPSILAHSALRESLDKARTAADLDALVKKTLAVFPEAKAPVPGGSAAVELAGIDRFYRTAAPEARAAAERRLYTDILAKTFDRRLRDEPGRAMALSLEARAALPDRPDVEARLRGQALSNIDVAALRQSEILEYAKLYEADKKPDEARALIRRWLDDQRKRLLTPTDAEGRVSLAGQYESMLQDRAAAESLLREAWAIDPQSQETSAAFRRLGYRLVDNDWQSTRPAEAPADKAAAKPPAPERDPTADALKGLTRKEVQDLQGKPAKVARTLTLGEYREQWIYQSDRKRQYINFVQRPDQPEAVVVNHHTIE